CASRSARMGVAVEPARRRPWKGSEPSTPAGDGPGPSSDGLGPGRERAGSTSPEEATKPMSDLERSRVTRRDLLRAGAALGVAAAAWAQAPVKVSKVLDFQTGADVSKAEQEGEVVYYGHDGEAGIAALLDAFRKDFPKIKTNYVRAQTGALYAKITAERSAGRFGVDVLQLSDISPAVDFQKKGGWESYDSPSYAGYKAEYQSSPRGFYGWAGVTFAGIAYNKSKLKPAEAPKGWKDILSPAYKDGISAKLSTSGMQHAQWYTLRKLYGNDFWQEFAKQRPKGFDSRAQLFDRLAKGDDRVCALAEYGGGTPLHDKSAGGDVLAPAPRPPPPPLLLPLLHRAPHPEAARLFVDWALSRRGQAVYQNEKLLLYGSLRP